MTILRTMTSLVFAFSAAVCTAQTTQREPANLPDLEVEVTCEEGTSHIALVDANSGSHISIGSVSKDRARVSPTTQLLRPLTRSWIGTQILTSDRPTRGQVFGADLRADIGACTDLPGDSQAASTGCLDGAGWCFCIPEGEHDCDAFHTFCSVIGGTSNHNTCSF